MWVSNFFQISFDGSYPSHPPAPPRGSAHHRIGVELNGEYLVELDQALHDPTSPVGKVKTGAVIDAAQEGRPHAT
jgi:hypothetical protein